MNTNDILAEITKLYQLALAAEAGEVNANEAAREIAERLAYLYRRIEVLTKESP